MTVKRIYSDGKIKEHDNVITVDCMNVDHESASITATRIAGKPMLGWTTLFLDLGLPTGDVVHVPTNGRIEIES